MQPTSTSTTDRVIKVLTATLGITDRDLDASTPLFGALPELDSMAVVELVVSLEQEFDITIGEDEVTGEVFETVGSLAALIDAKLS